MPPLNGSEFRVGVSGYSLLTGLESQDSDVGPRPSDTRHRRLRVSQDHEVWILRNYVLVIWRLYRGYGGDYKK